MGTVPSVLVSTESRPAPEALPHKPLLWHLKEIEISESSYLDDHISTAGNYRGKGYFMDALPVLPSVVTANHNVPKTFPINTSNVMK